MGESITRAKRTVEILKSPCAYWKSLSYEQRGEFQKIVWSKVFVKDRKVHTVAENKLFEIVKNANFCDGRGNERNLELLTISVFEYCVKTETNEFIEFAYENELISFA